MTARSVELRSDTFTRPTEAMRRAMCEAEVGDDVWEEDPTVKRLERRAAELMAKDAGLFVPSGTQGNLAALLSHTQPGDEVIVGHESHVFWNEVAGPAVVGGLQLRTVANCADGGFEPDEVAAAIRRGQDIHWPRTGCLALENTHNRCGGMVLTRQRVEEVAGVAHAAGVPVHLDGARIFNAAVALGIPAADLAAQVDSVMFCLSKGLGAPVGSVLCGEAAFVERARRWRKLLGGGMRQVGVLAAAGLVALGHNVDRLGEDQENARLLAEGLRAIRGVEVAPYPVQSNIVYFDVPLLQRDRVQFIDSLATQGVRVAEDGRSIRAVTSYEVARDDIEYALGVISHVVDILTPALA